MTDELGPRSMQIASARAYGPGRKCGATLPLGYKASTPAQTDALSQRRANILPLAAIQPGYAMPINHDG